MMNPDVVVVGAGPAGMSAALALNAAGARVRVVEEQQAAGGQVYRAVDRVLRERPEILSQYGSDYARGLDITKQLPDSGIELSFSTSVWDLSYAPTGPSIGLVKGTRAEFVHPRHIVLATGAMERPTPFPGWTLPGVMTVGAAQTLFKESALVPDSRPVIAGTGPLVYLFALQMINAGMKPAMILDTGPRFVRMPLWMDLIRAFMTDPGTLLKGRSWLKQIKQAGVDLQAGVSSLRAKGDQRLQSVEYSRGSKTSEIDTNLLLVHDGVIPNNYLAVAAGCEHRWNPLQRYWAAVLDDRGVSTQPGISITGDSAGIKGADAAICSGRIVGWNVAKILGLVDESRCLNETRDYQRKLDRLSVLRRFLDRHYQPFDYFQNPVENETIVCRCEEVTAGQLREVAALGCMGPNQAKAFTRCGMGPCMGRQCGNTVSQVFANYHARDVGDIGHYRIRPPIKPLTVEHLSNLDLS
jgi:NADPH-dependent 2,4-dienoyl-CoA reductase/sulfur reductase-like enzyme